MASTTISQDVGSNSNTSQERKQRQKHKKPSLTHFLCLPLITSDSRPHFEKAIKTFEDQLAQLPNPVVFPSRAVRSVGSLHLTLGIMSLTEDTELQRAKKLLEEVDLEQMLKEARGQPDENNEADEALLVEFKGLSSMGSAKKTSSLYIPPSDPNLRLANFCNLLRNRFVEAGLILKEHRPLRLHATIVNTIYARPGGRRGNLATKATENLEVDSASRIGNDDGENDEPNDANEIKRPDAEIEDPEPDPRNKRKDSSKKRGSYKRAGPQKFDAVDILEQFKNFEWVGNVRLNRVVICKMGAEKIKDNQGEIIDEVYAEVAMKELP